MQISWTHWVLFWCIIHGGCYFIFLTYSSPFPPLHLTNQAASTVHPIITLLSHNRVPWLTLEGAQKHLKTHLGNVFICLEWWYIIGLTLQGKPTSQSPPWCSVTMLAAQANGGAAGGGVWREAEGLAGEEGPGSQADERSRPGIALNLLYTVLYQDFKYGFKYGN